jgi:hypothetical protein
MNLLKKKDIESGKIIIRGNAENELVHWKTTCNFTDSNRKDEPTMIRKRGYGPDWLQGGGYGNRLILGRRARQERSGSKAFGNRERVDV